MTLWELLRSMIIFTPTIPLGCCPMEQKKKAHVEKLIKRHGSHLHQSDITLCGLLFSLDLESVIFPHFSKSEKGDDSAVSEWMVKAGHLKCTVCLGTCKGF